MEGEAKSKTKYLIIYKTMATRNIDQEKLALKKYQSIYKKNPTTPSDWASLHKLAYPTGVPEELKTATNESLGAAGISDPLSQTVEGSNLNQLRANVDTAKAGVEKTSQPNEALRVLQEAIRTKSGQAEQPLGTSKLFESAGLTGMGSLNASLSETTNKFKNDFTNFSNIVSQMSGTYKDMASTALNNYDMAYKEFTDEANRLQKIQDNLTNHAQAVELLNQQYENSIKLREYEKRNPGISEILAAETAGLENVDGDWLPKNRNIIKSEASGNTYDWSTYNAVGTPAEQAAYIKSVQDKIDSVGKLNNEQELQAYINKNMRKNTGTSTIGNITAKDIMEVSAETGVGWEELLGLLQKESEGGTSNVAVKNNNFGGITWSPTYQANNPNVTKGSPRPAKEGGNYVKFATVKDGLMAQAEQFAKRKVTTPITKDVPITDIDTIEQMYYKGGTKAERDARRKEIAKALETMTVEEYIATHPIGDKTQWEFNSQLRQAIAESSAWDAMSYEDKQKYISAQGGDPKNFEDLLY